jgi:hypothetical protein
MATSNTFNITAGVTTFACDFGATDKETIVCTIVSTGAVINSNDYSILGVAASSTAGVISIEWADAGDYVGEQLKVTKYTNINIGVGGPANSMLVDFTSSGATNPTNVQNEFAHLYGIVGQITGGSAVGTVDLGDLVTAQTNVDAVADILFDSPTLDVNGNWDGTDTLTRTVESIDADLATAETNISTLQTTVSSHSTSISALENAAFGGPLVINAADVDIADAGGYFTATTTEAALAELHTEAIYRAERQWLYAAIARPINRGYALTDANQAIAINGNEVMLGTNNSGGTGADNGVLYSSNRGGSYTARTSTISSLTSVLGLACNADGSLWIAVGVPATNDGMAWSNDNGATWTSSNDNSGQTIRSVSFDGSEFVAVGDAGTILTTVDGTVPVAQTAAGTPANITFVSVRWLESFNLWVACGLDTTTSNHGEIQTSTNGSTWVARTSAAFSGQFNEVTEFSLRGTPYAMVVGASGEIQYSANATTGWTNIPSASSVDFNSCVGVPGGAIIVGDSGIAQIVTNLSFSKGLYQLVAADTSNLNIVAYSASTGILVGGNGGTLYQTVDYDLES